VSAAAGIDRLARVAWSPARDDAVGDGELRLDPLARVGHEDAPARDEQVGGFVAPGDGQSAT